MGWQWTGLTRVLDPWLETEGDQAARSAVLRQLAELAEHAALVFGDPVAGASALNRSYIVEEAGVRLIWLRAEQFHILELVKIEPRHWA